jgi:hypothetical protein
MERVCRKLQLQGLWREGIRDLYRSIAGDNHVVAEVRVAGELCAFLAVARRQIEPLEMTARHRTWASDAPTRHIIRTDP